MGRKTIKEALRKAESSLRYAQERIKDLENQLIQKNRELKELRDTQSNPEFAASFDSELMKKEQEIEELRKILHLKDKQIRELSSEGVSMEASLMELKALLKAEKEKTERASETIDELKQENNILAMKLKSKEEEIAQKMAEINSLRSKREQDQQKIKDLVRELSERLQDHKNEMAEKNLKIEELRRQVQILRSELLKITERSFFQKVKDLLCSKYPKEMNDIL